MLSALRSRDFRLLWLSQTASVLGDGLVVVAIGLFVTRLTGDPGDVGVVLAGYAAPLVVFVLVGGVFADRLPRQAVMVVADAVRCVLHAVLALLIATGAVRIWQMVVIGLLYGTAQAFFQPAYTGLVPQTVPEEDIQAAQGLGGVSREVASLASPALATVLVLSVGGAAAFGLDAATFAVSAVMLARVRARDRGTAGARGSVLSDLLQGWTAVRERTWVWATIVATDRPVRGRSVGRRPVPGDGAGRDGAGPVRRLVGDCAGSADPAAPAVPGLGLDWMGSLALLPAGYLLAGPAAQWLGASRVLIGGGLFGLAVFALGLLPPSTRNLVRIEEPRPAS